MTSFIRQGAMAMALVFGVLLSAPAHAAIFGDDEARKAITDLRAVVARLQETVDTNARSAREETERLRSSLLDLNQQLERTRAENAQLRGQGEQLAREVSELQRVQKDIRQGVDDRIRKLEPQTVNVDGREFLAEPEETRQYEEATAVLRKGDFPEAANLLLAFQRRYPASGYYPASLFWLGNAQYGKREYKEAVTTFRTFVSRTPDHPRAPEALLSVANALIDLKDNKAARRTLDDLIKAYPKSEAAVAAKERMASLR